MEPVRVVVYASGGGSNAQALWEASQRPSSAFQLVAVLTDNPTAGVIQRSGAWGLPVYVLATRAERAGHLQVALLRQLSSELVALAGYLRKISPTVQQAFPDAILNIHPSLLPRFGGKGMYGAHVHRAVLAAGDTISGCTVHRVTGDYDTGEILAQATVSVHPADTPETLQARVLAQEHHLYPAALQQEAMRLRTGL